jgi:small GTP-binding protein
MPTNLPAEARAKWAKVMEAKTPEEKILALQEFISAVPKHKGTENLLLWARRRLSQLREEVEEKKKKGRGGGPKFYIEKEGAAQLVLIGPPNSGKTTILSKITNAKTEVREYPYSTLTPQPGMLEYEDIQFQLIDTPSIPHDNTRISWLSRVLGLARNADGVLIVLDAKRNPVEQFMGIKQKLESHGIVLEKPKAHILLEKTSKGGINIVVNGKLVDTNLQEIRKMLRDYGIIHAILRIWGEASLDDIENTLTRRSSYKPSIILLNKIDLIDEETLKSILKKLSSYGVKLLPISALHEIGLEKIGPSIFRELDIIRVYTKQPNGPVSNTPIVLKKGATVMDVAKIVHSRIARGFRYAKLWGKNAKFPGMRVGGDYIVKDGDVIEIYSKGA